jgi:hypothetical protein
MRGSGAPTAFRNAYSSYEAPRTPVSTACESVCRRCNLRCFSKGLGQGCICPRCRSPCGY